jgi:hypothetical protein
LKHPGITLKDVGPERVIELWELIKPKEPGVPEPLMIYPHRPGIKLIFRLLVYSYKMNKTNWGWFHTTYQAWLVGIQKHYNAIVDQSVEKDRSKNLELLMLWNYITQVQVRVYENTITQIECDRQKRIRKNST